HNLGEHPRQPLYQVGQHRINRIKRSSNMDAGNRGSFQAHSGTAAKASWPRPVLRALLLAAFCSLGLGLWAGSGDSQERRPAQAGTTAAADSQFTILKIEPDAQKEEVRIFFDKPLLLEGLKDNLRLLPLVK